MEIPRINSYKTLRKNYDVEQSIESYQDSFDALGRIIEIVNERATLFQSVGEVAISRNVRVLNSQDNLPYDWEAEGDFPSNETDERLADSRKEIDDKLKDPKTAAEAFNDIVDGNNLVTILDSIKPDKI